MTRDELRDAAAQMLGFPSYAQSRPEKLWIARAVTRAVYKAFQPEDDTRTRWAERTFGLHLPGAITFDIEVTKGSTQIALPQPDAMVVEGAGWNEANGVFVRSGEQNGKPVYGGLGGIEWLETSPDFFEWVFFEGVYIGFDNVDTPDQITSWSNVYVPPAPTVRRATWADIDAAGIDRSTLGGTLPINTFAGSYVVIGNTFYTFKERTDDSSGEFIEPYEGESGTVSATFYHNSVTLDPSVFSVMASPELLGYGQLSEITGKRQEILARGLVYNDYWPEDGAFYYNSLAIQKGATNSLLIGTPNFYFVDDTALGDSYGRRFVVHPLPQVAHSIKYRASVAPAIPATGDVPFPGPPEFADVVLIPILEKICSSSKRYDGKNQRELATEYASALSTLRRFSRNQKRRPSRLRVRPGY